MNAAVLYGGLYRVVSRDATVLCVELCDASHPVFKAHFENNPILPGFMQIDIVAQCLGKRVTSISQAKFMKPVRPQERICFEIKESERSVQIRVNDTGGNRVSDLKLLWSDY